MGSRKISPTLRVLQEIRDELRQHGELLREHGELLREHGGRLEAIERRQTETEVRIATELTAVAGAVQEVRDLLRERLDDRTRVDDHEARLRVLERKVG
ncbi:MAG TPA: hypothetical protein VGJ84_12285 [Polyangiaceae bacterium]|jgi:phage host-nuclease inhibitor protein Gam